MLQMLANRRTVFALTKFGGRNKLEIRLNGTQYRVNSECTAEKLIAQLGLAKKKLALEINGQIIPRSEYGSLRVRTGDAVEIIHAVGGG